MEDIFLEVDISGDGFVICLEKISKILLEKVFFGKFIVKEKGIC